MAKINLSRAESAHGMRFTAAVFLFIGSMLLAATVAASPPRISESAAKQMAALKAIKASKTPIQNKIDSRLYLGMLHQRQARQLALLTDFRFVKPEADGRVPVEILLASAGGMKAVLNKLESLGAEITSKSMAYHLVHARVRFDDLEPLAALKEVRKMRQPFPRMTNKINTSEGDKTHGADEVRGYFGTTGAGVKVCVLSDGVDSLSSLQASGDLPAVDVLSGQAGSGDEGSAMLEIVHDLAPAAELGFATADPTEAQFAQNILDLADSGCNIIVDDIIYLDESPFEDGPVAQSVNTVTANGVLYFSSAGNEGNKDDGLSGTWEGDFSPSAAADPAPLSGANLHDFGDGGNSIVVTYGGGNPPLLIWAEHYDLDNGSASTDYDLYDMDAALTTIFDASTDVQDGTGNDDFPIEFIGNGTYSGERLLIDKFSSGSTSSSPIFNLIVFRGQLDTALATNGATRGHSAARDAFSVAATPAAASFDGVTPDGPYPGLFTTANESESFSSDGPRRIILDADGSEITPGNRTSTGGEVRQKPDITAADGVSTAAPGFAPFYGTSAAAPHAAAIAALLKSARPSLTPAEVRTALTSTAIDIEAAGVDRDTGAGIVMPHAALDSVGAQPSAFLNAGIAVPTQAVGDGDGAIENNEIWKLTVPLANVGGAEATAVSATLATATPGVSVLSADSSYADLATGASGDNASPFVIRVDSVPCGTSISFTLTVNYSGGVSATQDFQFNLPTGSAGAPVTVSYTGPVIPIPDGGDLSGGTPGAVASVDLPVSGIGANIHDVNFSIDGATCSSSIGATTVGIDHSFVNDLQISLIAPDGTSDLVINHTDGGGNNFCQVVLDDQSAGPSIQSVATANAPFTGSYTPNSRLSVFQGKAADGTWQLQAQDFYSQDTGNIRAFSVTITPAVCDAPARVPVALQVTSGDAQSTAIGTPFASPLTVTAVDSSGYGVGGVQVNFAAPASGPSAALSSSTATTDNDGSASITATANTLAGSYGVNASADGVPDVVFALTNTPSAPVLQVTISGSPQSTTVGTGFPAPLAVQVRDSHNNPVPNVVVAFSVPNSGAGAVLSAGSATTDGNGVASITAVANDDPGSYQVVAHVEGVSPDAAFDLTNTAAVVSVAVTVSDGREYARYGRVLDYLVKLTNSGPSAARHVGVSSTLGPQIDADYTTWTCVDADSGACTASGGGTLADPDVTIPANGSVTYLLSAPVSVDASGDSVQTSVTASSPDQVGDVTAIDSDVLVIYRDGFDLSYADGAGTMPLEPVPGVLSADRVFWFKLVPTPAMQPVETVLRAYTDDGSGFRLDRVVLSTGTWLRLVTLDNDSREIANPWYRVVAGSALDLGISVAGDRASLMSAHGGGMVYAGLGAIGKSYRIEVSDAVADRSALN